MKTITVFRVESKTKPFFGPYQTTAWHKRLSRSTRAKLEEMFLRHNRERPLPHKDGIDHVHVSFDARYGFLYMEDLLRWFDGYMPALAEAGFHVVRYEVDDRCLQIGYSGQVAFSPAHSQRVEVDR